MIGLETPTASGVFLVVGEVVHIVLEFAAFVFLSQKVTQFPLRRLLPPTQLLLFEEFGSLLMDLVPIELLKQLVGFELIHGVSNSFLWVQLEAVKNEPFQGGRRTAELLIQESVFDFVNDFRLNLRAKGVGFEIKDIGEDSQSPKVRLLVHFLHFDHFGGNVVDGSLQTGVQELLGPGEIEVAQLHLARVHDQHILSLQITINDLLRMEIQDGLNHLRQNKLYFPHREPHSLVENLKDVSMFGVLDFVVEFVFALEGTMQLEEIWMVQAL